MAGQQIAIIHFFFVFLLPTIWKSFQNSYTFQGYKTKEKKEKKERKKNHNCKRVWNKTNLYKVKVCYL